jgi:predicted amidohydrolase
LDAREEGITMHAIAVQTPHPSLGPLAHWTQQGTAALPESTKGIVPTLAVWPEYSFEFDARGDDGTWQALQKVARDTGTALVFGSVHERGNDRYSSAAYVVDAGGRSLGLYEKHNPLPFFQDGEPGTGYPLFRIPGRVHPSRQTLDMGALICFDLSFERNAISAADLIARVAARYRVRDLTLEEPEIEEIIRRVYEGDAIPPFPAGEGEQDG